MRSTPSRPWSRGLLRWTALLLVVDAGAFFLGAQVFHDISRALGAVILWGAASLLAVCVLYVAAAAGGDAGLVLKGERWPWLQPLFFPFRLVSFVVFAVSRVLRRGGDTVCEVVPGLAIGPRLFAWEAEELRSRGYTGVVDLTSELPVARVFTATPFERHAGPTLDRAPPTDPALDRAVAWTVERIASGRAVYVHCAFGRGRSALVTAAVLVRLGHATTADEAVAKVAAARPQVRVAGEQWDALVAWVARQEPRPTP